MRIVIVGAGQVGFHIAGRLAREDKDVVVIDQDPDAIRRVAELADVQTVVGSGSDPSILEEAGIRDAEILLAVTNEDETNLVACLLTDILSPSTRKMARIRDAAYDHLHEALRLNAPHIDTVINPETEVLNTIERLMSVPGAVDVNEFAGGRVKVIGIRLEESAPLAKIRLSDLPRKIQGHRPLIAAILRNERLVIPKGNDRLLPGDIVYFISEEAHLSETLRLFNCHAEPVRRVMIIGGGSIGTRLAHRLSRKGIQTKLVERNASRCEALAEELDDVVVLRGDGSDQELLLEENIRDMDVVVSVTNDEETNILCSLLAKRLGARKTITRFSKFSYFPLMLTIGIEQVVDPRLSAINTILQHIRKGRILSAVSLKGEEGEVLEAMALETSDVVNRPIRDISFPKGALITAILRGDQVIIPGGDTVILPDDRIIIFARKESIAGVEKRLAVKLEYI